MHKTILAITAALALSACDEDSAIEPQTEQVTITAIDGYLANAKVLTGSNCTEVLGNTNENGKLSVDVNLITGGICVQAIAGETTDLSRGPVTENFELRASKGSVVVSPLTTLVDDLITTSPELSIEQAQQQVSTQLAKNGLNISSEQLFGDYLVPADNPKELLALQRIGESLVDQQANNLSVATQQQVVNSLGLFYANTLETVDDFDKLAELIPAITLPSFEGDTVKVHSNTRPKLLSKNITKTLELNDAIQLDASSWFTDQEDGSALSLSVVSQVEAPLLSINSETFELSGNMTQAGVFNYTIFAKDSAGASSLPMAIQITVNSNNQPPTYNEEVKKAVKAEIENNTLMQHAQYDAYKIANITNLFTDKDGDDLSYSFEAEFPNISFSVDNNGALLVSGSSDIAGDMSLLITVKDGTNSEGVSLLLPVNFIANEQEAETPSSSLEGTWYHLEHGRLDHDNRDHHHQIYCDTIRFENGVIYKNLRSTQNLTSCGEANENVGSYELKDNKILASFTVEPEEFKQPPPMEMTIAKASSGPKQLSGQVLITFSGGGETEGYTYYNNKTVPENMLTIRSSGGPGERQISYPIGFIKENITLSMQLYEDEADDGAYTHLYLWFDNAGDLNCQDIQQNYETIAFSANSFTWESYEIHCQLSDSYTPIVYIRELQGNLGMPSLVVGKHYSVLMESVDTSHMFFSESIRFNIEWTGTANKD